MPDPKEYVAGSSSLVLGVDSYTSPAELGDQEFLFGQNVTVRGGIVQTRPGSRSLYCPPQGNFQGFKVFTPDNGVAHHVFVVDGKVYVSAAPFTSYRRLWNLQFSPTSKYISWTVCLKSTDYDNEGNIYSLDNPYSVLVMQDGLTRAAYWDGGNSGHLNPGPPPYPNQNDILPGYDETPIGLWSAWSGNRLWVARENQVFASDIGNPLKFTEEIYLNEARAFQLSGPCTGMIVTPDQQGIIVFTETNGTFFQSTIENRPTWLDTPDFQKVIIPNVGCVAPRSLVTQYGLTWWFGPRGLTNVDAALRLNVTSRIDYKDNEMFSSKAYLGPDLSGVCASFYENYLMVSVPSGDVLNRHTWVLDQAPFEGNVNAWAGIWTGWRPVEWGRGIVNGSERIFFGSVDYDGRNRVWEAMLPERTDNGCAITCYAQLRDHAAGDLNRKRYDWSKFFLSQIYGDVDLNVYVASTKGGYQLQKGYHLVASEGQVFSDTEYSEAGPFLMGNRVQSRIIRTPGGMDDNDCNKCGVESQEGNLSDYAFSHLLVWSGQMGIRAYQMHMHELPERDAGDCEEAETAPRTLNAQGCSGLDFLVQGEIFEEFEATAEDSTMTREGGSVYIRQTATSVISEENAQALAECRVAQIIAQLKGQSPAVGVYNSGSAEMGTNTSFVVVEGPITPPIPVPPEICPPTNRMLLPPMTESSGLWYADLAEAESILSGDWVESCNGESCSERIVIGCIAYGTYGAPDPDPTISRTYSASGSTSLAVGMSRSLHNVDNSNTMYASVELQAGSILSVAWSMGVTFPGVDDGQIDVFAKLYDSLGNTIQILTSSSTGPSPLNGSGTFVFDPLIATGRYILVLQAVGSGAPGGNAVVSTFTATSDDTMAVLPITALYHNGGETPSCLACVP